MTIDDMIDPAVGYIILNGFDAAGRQKIRNALVELYGEPDGSGGFIGGSATFRALFSPVVSGVVPLNIDFASNAASADVGGFQVYIDSDSERVQVTDFGQVVNTGLAAVLCHELVHAVGGANDVLNPLANPDVSANPDYLGNCDWFTNLILLDLGLEPASTYNSKLRVNGGSHAFLRSGETSRTGMLISS